MSLETRAQFMEYFSDLGVEASEISYSLGSFLPGMLGPVSPNYFRKFNVSLCQPRLQDGEVAHERLDVFLVVDAGPGVYQDEKAHLKPIPGSSFQGKASQQWLDEHAPLFLGRAKELVELDEGWVLKSHGETGYKQHTRSNYPRFMCYEIVLTKPL